MWGWSSSRPSRERRMRTMWQSAALWRPGAVASLVGGLGVPFVQGGATCRGRDARFPPSRERRWLFAVTTHAINVGVGATMAQWAVVVGWGRRCTCSAVTPCARCCVSLTPFRAHSYTGRRVTSWRRPLIIYPTKDFPPDGCAPSAAACQGCQALLSCGTPLLGDT